jgi:hypothetical protein
MAADGGHLVGGGAGATHGRREPRTLRAGRNAPYFSTSLVLPLAAAPPAGSSGRLTCAAIGACRHRRRPSL